MPGNIFEPYYDKRETIISWNNRKGRSETCTGKQKEKMLDNEDGWVYDEWQTHQKWLRIEICEGL